MILYCIGIVIFFAIAMFIIYLEGSDIDLEFNSIFIQNLIIFLFSLVYPIVIITALLILIDEKKGGDE